MEGSSNSSRRRSDNNFRALETATTERNLSLRDQADPAPSHQFRNFVRTSGFLQKEATLDTFLCGMEWTDVSLRQWLDDPMRSIGVSECLHIFRQIVEIVNVAHSQGIVVNNVRPSCFVMSSFNRVSFIESASCSDSGSDSLEDGLNNQIGEVKHLTSFTQQITDNDHNSNENASQPVTENASQTVFSDNCPQPHSKLSCLPFLLKNEEYGIKDNVNFVVTEEKKESFPMKKLLVMETSWYTSPEEIGGAPNSCASDIYRLGVLLFELFCTFSSTEEKSSTMSSLRHRVLPPHMLLKWPKEASCCLWLLHPDPSSRPKTCELLQSEFLNEPREDIEERQAAIELRQKIEEEELLREFLGLMQHAKQEDANKLQNFISLLSSDIEEILNKQRFLNNKGRFTSEEDYKAYREVLNLPRLDVVEQEEATSLGQRKQLRPRIHNAGEINFPESQNSDISMENRESLVSKHSQLMKNFNKLESAYILTRTRHVKPVGKHLVGHSLISGNSRGSMVLTERSSVNSFSSSGWINPFLEGLCKYLSFTELRVKANLRQGDLLNSSNLVCCVSFDRDGEFFAAAGVNKKIKVFECDTILDEDRDIHYPVVEMTGRSKLSCICWNNYIKNQMVSSNFDGALQVWDVSRNQTFMEFNEHERRVWSVSFSLADPTILASGSDDGFVKLWSINQGASIGSIRTKANVCCVQFPSHSGHYLAFGSADHKVYYYDLRNTRVPLCTMIGHNRTVSYVKFVDSTNLVSASTDNTIKLWDLSTCNSQVIETPILSYGGHTNIKNFVGLAVSDGYIATGSETNEVVIYHKAFSMPALSHTFNNTDQHSNHESDFNNQFVSSVCWRGHSSMLVAANSTGAIRILEMV